ncbi:MULTISPECIES: DUF2079 domain-containing protein [Aeromicrobium]|uniref:DUF2079 domain-containing protein n=1 Tax=Aeromicrobium TaxID=2040 RepID=UPI0025796822|nr:MULTISPECIES: DUF2079 domain-containing protein [Aeromicrobium]
MNRWMPWVWAAVVGMLYSLISLLSWRRLTVNSWDNAIFEQAVKAYSRFEAPIVPVKGPGYNILGDHFSPIDALLAPAYWLFPYGQTLLVAQGLLIGLSVVPITRLAVDRLGPRVGWTIALMYGLAFGFGNAVVADFHEVAFAVPILAMAGVAFVEQRYSAVVWWSLPLLLVKEDMGVTVAAVGVALWLAGERRRGLLLALGGAVALVLVVWVIIPAFNTGGGYDYTGNLGGEVGVWETLTTEADRKLLTLLLTFGVTGFAALWSPWAVVAAPTFLWRFLGDVEYYWGTEWHYSIVIMPIVFVAMIDAIGKRPRLEWPGVVLGAAVGGYLLAGGPVVQLLEPETWDASPRREAMQEAIATIPEDAVVETDIAVLKYLTGSHDAAYWIGTIGDVVPDYIIFDRNLTQTDPIQHGAEHGASYEVVFERDNYVVARKVG